MRFGLFDSISRHMEVTMVLDLTGALVAGIPLMLIVIGLVQFVKEKIGWSGMGVEIFAIVLGTVFGFGYHVYAAEAIAWTYSFIFEGVMYGLTVGLVATGIYKAYHEEK
jgi:hypothetical protein